MTVILKISKLDAARRQLDTAIELWFREADPVSIAALVFNASQIIQDVNEKSGNKHVTTLAMAQRLAARPEHVGEIMRLWKKPVAFLKHANRDPHDILEFRPDATEMTIVLAIHGLGLLGEQGSDLINAFNLWQALHKPEIFLEGANPIEKSFSVQQRDHLRQVKKPDFLKAALLGSAQRRTTKLW